MRTSGHRRAGAGFHKAGCAGTGAKGRDTGVLPGMTALCAAIAHAAMNAAGAGGGRRRAVHERRNDAPLTKIGPTHALFGGLSEYCVGNNANPIE